MEDRTLRVGLVSLFASISVPVGSALSGVLFRKYRFYGVYAISTALYLFSLVYGMAVIRDSEPAAVATVENGHGVGDKTVAKLGVNTSSALADFFDLKHIKDAYRVAFKRDNDNRRTDIVLLLIVVVVLVGPLSGQYSQWRDGNRRGLLHFTGSALRDPGFRFVLVFGSVPVAGCRRNRLSGPTGETELRLFGCKMCK